MPDWLVIVLIAAVGVIILFAVGGAIANRRRVREGDVAFRARLQEADRSLAAAAAEDRGWSRESLDAAARAAFGTAHPGETVTGVHLVQVLDRPGTDQDEAVLAVETPTGRHEIRLGRRGDEWFATPS